MSPLTPQKRTRLSPAPTGSLKKARYMKNGSDSDDSGSPTVSTDTTSGHMQGHRRKQRPASLTPRKSLDGLYQFGKLQIATPSSSRFAQHSPGIQASHAALEIEEALGMEQGSSEADEADEKEVFNAMNAHPESDADVQSENEVERDVTEAIREYIYPPPLYRFKHTMVDGEAYGPEQAVMEGETLDEEEHASDKPVRVLDKFIFYLDTSRQLCGLGEVYPKIDEDDLGDTESENGDTPEASLIYLGPIVDAYQGDANPYTNALIWVETELAWYILAAPHPLYREAYKPFLIAHTFTLILSRLVKNEPLATPEQFYGIIQDPHGIYNAILRNAGENLDYKLGLVDFWSNIGGVRMACANIGSQTFVSAPLISQLLGQLQPSKPRAPPSKEKLSFISQDAGIQNSVTPLIYQIANKHFLRPLACLGRPLADCLDYQTTSKLAGDLVQTHADAPCHVIISSADSVEGPDGNPAYTCIQINGVRYQRGDIVLVMPGKDHQTKRQHQAQDKSAKSQNDLGNVFWFAEIIYFFKNKKGIVFHAHWLLHSSKSFLHETGDPQELFLINECSNSSVESIVCHVQVDFMGHGEQPEPCFDPSIFFCRFLYQSEKGAFLDVAPHRARNLPFQAADCYPCLLEAEQHLLGIPRLLDKQAILYKGVTYHLQECAFIKPDSPGPYILGQIQSIAKTKDKLRIQATILHRHGSDSRQFYDDRKLCITATSIQCSAERLCGKFYAISQPTTSNKLEHWLELPNHFWIASPELDPQVNSFRPCLECLEHELDVSNKKIRLIQQNPLKALDLFSGCGGLDKTKIITTKWSIENNPHAVKTLRKNMPKDHIVISDDINTVLAQVIQQSLGSYDDPSLPGLDEVDVIYGGPPCQSFSQANGFKKDDDPRHSLSLTALSFVDLYRPSYVILENVRGMVDYHLVNADGEMMKMGVPKLWLRCLTAMDYQVHLSVLEAGAYGTPQCRARLIVIAARRGCSLPSFPLPTHAFPRQPRPIHTPDGASIASPSSMFAPLPPITVKMAIGDLPHFHWNESGTRDFFSPVFTAELGWGYQIAYKSHAQTRYQASLRNPIEKVQQHFTKIYSSLVSKRVVHIPMTPGACWKDLPKNLWDRNWKMKPLRSSTYKRVIEDQYFPTSVCKVDPTSRFGQVLHPNQRRVISLREYARAQGFPDTFIFWTTDSGRTIDELFKQVGNAVPIPLGFALGQTVMFAMVSDHIFI
ncbi:hypothetical protein M407DRAFT_22836 [Tulasnella calospora MUT 4182]|uniref:Cytosine-specific methyltransferase n=1 Tax=Tulasnella calospora MUT 4182 TaxID=1051891 RepID=A0A0C3QKL1_9AGAM|nr:hypothetical protein M407DRAFT_22836 [Tulasnella calospora MUT 4182]